MHEDRREEDKGSKVRKERKSFKLKEGMETWGEK
jgi:hypothetical protein